MKSQTDEVTASSHGKRQVVSECRAGCCRIFLLL